MMVEEYKVKKRNGNVTQFDESKIVNAITKAFGGSVNYFTLASIIERVANILNFNDDTKMQHPIDIETIQDAVEAALIIEGHREVGRNYILYRDEKMKEREQKLKLLEVATLTDVEKRYSYSALKIFKERYLLKDNEGKTCERLHELFERVAVASGIMDVLYDPLFYDKDGKQPKSSKEDKEVEKILADMREMISKIDYKELRTHESCGYVGKFIINPFHQERLITRFLELRREGKIKTQFLDMDFLSHSSEKYEKQIQKYYDLMAHKIFLPNTPCLMNAGTKLGQNAACFTLKMEDSIDGIGKTNADIMRIFKSGGGIGINYSDLRHEGAFVNSTGGVSSGPISFLKIVDQITATVAQAGKRRGAAMAIMDVDHKDIIKFIELKDNKTLENHNISVCMNNQFFEKYFNNDEWATDIMNRITTNAWKTADPGMVFLENMNSNNLLYPIFNRPIKVTNPCSEISMYEYDSCILASINLTRFVDNDGKFNTEKFRVTTSVVTQFLDGIVDATKYPVDEINEMTKGCRRIGVGYMGLGDVMTQLGIAYNSEEGFRFTEYVTALMTAESLNTSAHMANIKGCFPYWYKEEYEKNRDALPVSRLLDTNFLVSDFDLISKYLTEYQWIGKLMGEIPVREYGLRNCSTTTIAPTGSLSMFVDCSSGIEPVFANGFVKKITIGDFSYVNRYLVDALKKEGIYTKELIEKIVKEHGGRLSDIPEIPDHIKRVFITAMEIHPYDHIMMQAVAQRWITNGISKTINGPEDMTTKDIEYSYILAWAMGVKGTTVYRNNCKSVQVLNSSSTTKTKSNLKTSDYTLEYIHSMKNIPDHYKRELLRGGITKDGVDDKYGFYQHGNVAVPSIVTETWHECSNCHSINSIIPNGSRCLICKNCGNQIGCSTT